MAEVNTLHFRHKYEEARKVIWKRYEVSKIYTVTSFLSVTGSVQGYQVNSMEASGFVISEQLKSIKSQGYEDSTEKEFLDNMATASDWIQYHLKNIEEKV